MSRSVTIFCGQLPTSGKGSQKAVCHWSWFSTRHANVLFDAKHNSRRGYEYD